MAVSARSARQFGSIFQNKLENLGGDLGGDHLAAVRANYQLQIAKAASATGGELADQAITGAGVSGGTFATEGTIGTIGLTIAANVYGDLGQFSLSATNAATLGLDFDDPSWSKLHNGLAEMFVESQLAVQGLEGFDRAAALARFQSSVPASLVAAGYVAIDAVAKGGDGAGLLAQLNALGMIQGASFGAMAGGFIAIDKLDELAHLDLLNYASPVLYETNAGSVQSQDVAAMNVDYLHSAYGLTGAGIAIGFMSDSFNTATLTTQNTALTVHYAQDITSGDLPAGVNILEDGTGTAVRDEGRAMAQLAYDIAPGISILFHTANPSQANFAQGIIDLYNAGADIIVDDVRYFQEPFFQDGIIAQAVDTVTAGGAMYFSSAGNQGTLSYESVYRPSDQTINITGSPAVAGIYRFHDFDPGAGQDFVQSFTKTGTGAATYVLNWDNPSAATGGLGASADLAIIIFNAAGTPIAAFSSNNVGADAIEVAQNSSTTWAGFAIGVREAPGFAQPTFIKTVISGSVTLNEWTTNSGTSFGHSNASGANAVGAVDWIDSGRFAAPYVAGENMPYLETFSSRGDIPIFFDTAGNRLSAPQWRSTVDFSAADGGNNTFFGSDNANSGAYAGFEADTNPNFYGTSAAAPNAAALAALMMQAFPTATRAQIEQAFKMTALDVQVTYTGTQIGDGYDNRSGYGLIQADRAYQMIAAMLNADTVVQTGEVALVSYETDTSAGGSPDGLRFVLLSDIAAGTTIYISDRTWNGTAFAAPSAGEGTYAWTSGGAMTAGTVVTLSAATLATGGVTLSNAGETLYFYQGGQDAPTRFLFAADIADGNGTFNGSLVGTGLTAGTNAVAVSLDNGLWQGTPTGIAATTLASIANQNNWYSSDQDDIAGTTGYTEVTDTTVNSPSLDGSDMVIIAGFTGGGQSDAILRIGEENGAGLFQNLSRVFRDHPQITRIEDVSLDLESGFFFFADTDGNSINRIMRGNIADLVSGNQSATFTQIFATDGQSNGAGPVLPGELINGIEVDRVNNQIYWWDGDLAADFEGGWQLNRVNYDGTGLTTIALLDSENALAPAPFNGIGDWALDLPRGFGYVVSTTAGVDGFGVATVYQNHILRVNLSTGVITVLALDAADPRSNTGGGSYNDGRLDPAEGQIIALDVDSTTGIVYFITQPTSASGNGGVWSYNPATDDLQELWNQPAPNAFTTLQTFPTGNMNHIEVDEIGGRLFISTSGSIDHENDATPGTNEHDASIYVRALAAANGTAPTRFVRVYEPTALGSPTGMEINYDSNLTLTSLNATYTESTNGPGSPAGPVVTPFNNATITDPDNTSVYGAQVAITSGFVSGDTLSFTNSGGITGSYNSATGVVTFTGLATLAQYQTVLNSIRFTNAGDNPTDYGNSTTRVISANVFDGLVWGDLTSVGLTVVGINDAPVNTVPGAQAASEDTGKVISGLSVSDPDADPANQLITVTLHVNHGTIAIFTNAGNGVTVADVTGNGTATVTITATQNQINATFAHATGVTYTNTLDYNGVDTLTITTNDNGLNGNDPGLTGTGTSEQDQDTVTINIAAVNDAPQVVGDGTEDSITIFEDQPSAVGQTVNVLFSGQYTDQRDNQIPNGGASSPGAFSGVAVIANASSAGTGNWQYFNTTSSTWVDIGARTASTALLISEGTALRFNPAANYNGPEPLLTVRLIDNSLGFGINFQVVDLSSINSTGGTTAYSVGTVTLGGTIIAVNDAPTSTNLQADSATYVEGATPVFLDVGSNATIVDIDSLDFDGGTLTVAITTGLVAGQDQLGIDTSGSVTVAGNAVSVGGIQIATFTGGGAGGTPLVFTLDPDATPAAVQALVRAITYVNSDTQNPTGGARTVTWTLVDGDGTANGGADTLTVTSNVNVLPVNDEPSGADHTATLLEDGSYTLATADFGFSDPAEGNAFAGVVLTALPGAGSLLLNGVPITVAGTFISAADITGGLLTYQPAPNGNGTGYASFTFQVRDNGGTANGGQDTDQTPNTFTFDVTAVNDAPTSTNLSGDAASYTEGSAGVALDVGGNATIGDIDSLNFDGGTLTVAITNVVAAEDQLFVAATGGVTVAGNAVSVGGIQIATFTGGGAGGASLVFTFDPDATPAAVQALIHAIQYTNSDLTSPTGGIRNISWTLVDGDGTANGGADTLNVTSSVEVINVNTAPDGADATFTLLEDGSRTLSQADFGFSDPTEGDAFAGVVITTLPTDGALLLNGVPITVAGTFVSAANISGGLLVFAPSANENGVGYASFTFQVRDNGGTANGGQDTDQTPNTITFNVTPVNDAPTSTNLSGDVLTWIEGSGPTALDVGGNATIADVDSLNFDGGTLTVAITAGGVAAQDVLGINTSGTVTVAGNAVSVGGVQIATFTGGSNGNPLVFTLDPDATPATVQALVRAITYNNSGGLSPTGGTRTINWTLVDGDGTANSGADTLNLTSSVDVQPINDAPTGTDATYVINEDSTYVFTAASFGFGDINGDDFAGVVVTTVAVPGTLYYDADGAGGAAPTAVTAGQFISAADIALGRLTFTPANDANGTPFTSFTFQVRDDGGTANGGQDTDQTPNTLTFNVTALNDAPIAYVPGSQTVLEDGVLTLSTGTFNALQVADVDATTLTVTLGVAHGTLTLASTLNLSFSIGDGSSDATMTFSGTAAAINAALGTGLTYNPTANFNGSDAIAINVSDNGEIGAGGIGTDSDTVAINITAVNDAPVVIGDGTESATTIDEDTPGGGQTVNALFAGQYSDAADNQIPNGGASSPGAFSGIAVTANGSTAGAGQWQYFNGASWVDIGTVSDAAAKLFSNTTLIRFNPALNFNGPAPTLTVHLVDNSLGFGITDGQVVNASVTGGTTAYSSGVVVLSQSVTAVNDAPVNGVPGPQVINEDSSLTLSTANGNAISVADVDATTLTVTLNVVNGTITIASTLGLTFSGGSDGTNDVSMTFSGTAAAINAALGAGLTYNPNANYNGSFNLNILTTDNGQTGTGGTLIDSDLLNITVNSVNDAPQGTDGTVTGSEDDPYVFTLADFGYSDPVEGNAFLAVRINSFPAQGILYLDTDGPGGAAPVNLATVGVGVFVSAADIAAGHLYFQPDPDEYGDNYASFLFQVQDNGGTANGGVDLDPSNNTITIDIEPDNLPPVVDLDSGTAGVDYTTTFVEDGTAVAIGSGIAVSDPDSVTLGDLIESAKVTLTDRVAGDSLVFSSPLPLGFSAIVTSNATTITIEISGTGSQAQYAAILQSIVYSTTSQDPDVGGTDTSRTITVTVNDGDIDSAVATTTVNITPIDDLPVAQPDFFTITESGTIIGASLFANNGSGADSDPDGPPLSISAVNGSGANVGTQITLGSGALLTVNANGTFSYDPNGAFLPTPTLGSGASNTPSHDGFTYTVAGGNTVSVFITLTGLDTDDFLLGTAGADILMGGLGNDTYIVENTSDQVIEAAGQGFDSVYTSVSYALAAGSEVEWLAAIDQNATTALALVGNSLAQYLVGNNGANIFSGGGGADLMIGHGGNDTYYVTDAGAVAQEAVGEGFDAVYASLSYVLAQNSEVEWLSTVNVAATTAINLTGNNFSNYVTGNAGSNILDGGTGADFLYGLAGNDTYFVDNFGDLVTEHTGEGFDSVYTTVSWALAAGQEVEWVSAADINSTTNINLTGNELVQYIVGNAGNNILTGGGGADFLYGREGNDIYIVTAGTTVFESAGGGNDSVLASTSYTLNNGAEVEFLGTNDSNATTAINLTGNELNNTIYGNAGNNVLDGKLGNDSLVGLAGADTFAFTTALGPNNVDIILGFTHNVDKIALDDAIFTAAGPLGALNANAFVVGSAAADASDRIIYNNLTGQLFYDADGNGAGAAVLFANLSPGLTLTASDFQVI